MIIHKRTHRHIIINTFIFNKVCLFSFECELDSFEILDSIFDLNL